MADYAIIFIFLGLITSIACTITFFLFKEKKTLLKQLDSYQESNDMLNIRLGSLSEKLEETFIRLDNINKENDDLRELFELEQEKSSKILSQKKSSETRLGYTAEHLAVFLESFPYSPSQCHFQGAPIDIIVYNLDEGEIIFLEVKTGNSRESKRQKIIKNLIKSGKVYYECLRISPKGVKITRENNI